MSSASASAERGELRRLQDDGVSPDERCGDLGRGEHERVIERDDAPHHAERLAQRVVEAPLTGRDRLAAQLQREPGEVAQLPGGGADVALHLVERAAVVDRVQAR